MDIAETTTEKRRLRITWALILLFFLLFSYLVPKVCDDWSFTSWLKSAQSSGGFLQECVREWNELNGRILGNGLSLAFAGNKALRVLFKTGVYAAILLLLGRLTKVNTLGGAGLALMFAVLMLLPLRMHNETYFWDAGYFNYVVPAALILCYLQLISPLFYGKPLRDSFLHVALAFLLGLCSPLFVENVAAYIVVLGVFTIIWHKILTRRISLVTVFYFVGAMLGTVLLFSSPALRKVAASVDGGYRAIPNSLTALLAIIKENYQAFSFFSFGGYTLLHILLSGSALCLLHVADADAKKARLQKVLTCLLIAMPLYFFISTQGFDALRLSMPFFETVARISSFYIAMLLDLVCYGLYMLSLLCVFLLYVQKVEVKRLGILCLLSALVIAAPMLLVKPTGARCFYDGYLLMGVAALLLFTEAIQVIQPSEKLRKLFARAVYAMMAVICAVNIAIYISCPKLERIRVDYLRQQMQIEAVNIVLPEFECEDYLNCPNSFFEEFHYKTPGDINYSFIPYADWVEEFSGGLSEEDWAQYYATHPNAAQNAESAGE